MQSPALPTPTHLAPALRTQLFLSTAASILPETGGPPRCPATPGTPSATATPARSQPPLAPPPRPGTFVLLLLGAPTARAAERARVKEETGREGGGRVTSAPCAPSLSPGRKGQRGTAARYHQAWHHPASPACTPRARGHAAMDGIPVRVTASHVSVPRPDRRGGGPPSLSLRSIPVSPKPSHGLLPEAVGVPVGVQRLQVLPIVDALPAARTHRQVGPWMERGDTKGTGLSPCHLSPSSLWQHPGTSPRIKSLCPA